MVSGKQSPQSQRPEAVPYAVGLYITAAYWFTASTSFANPAVTIARSLSDTFAGIAPGGVAAFVVAQLAGMLVAVGLSRRLWRKPNDRLGSFASDRNASDPRGMSALSSKADIVSAHSRRQLFANAPIAASRVSAYPRAALARRT
jgi:glycerol uptake facilitator-like aquaporin